MQIEKFEDIIAWQKSQELILTIYKLTQELRDYGYIDQIRRAAISVANNIAEGFERKSNKEFKQFLYIAKGSAGEVRSLLYTGKSLKYFNNSDYQYCYENIISISKLIYGLIKTL